MKQHIIFSGLLFLGLNVSSSSWASMQEVTVKENSRLLLSCEEASVSLSGAPSPALKIVLDSASESLVDVSVSTDAFGAELIQIRDKVGRAKILDGAKNVDAKNHLKIEISGRSVPAEIHLLDGHLSLKKWQKEVYAHVQKGKLVARENSNSLIVHMQKGEISVTDHEGKVIIDSLQTSTSIKELKGDLEAQSFMGDLVLEKLKGSINVSANQGSIKVISGSGSLQFELQKANLSASQFDGRVEGQSQEGNVSIQTGPEPDINVKSQSGRVSISAGSNSGALLNLASTEGDVVVPSYLKVGRDGSLRTLKGRLKGDTQKGAIFVRSQEGVIVVK